MLIKSFFSGFGGQGVLLMGYTLAYSAMMEEKEVTYLPAYGAEVRGGTAHCTICISDDDVIASPVASSPDFITVMNKPSMEKFQSVIQPGGVMLINTTLVDTRPTRGDIQVYEIPATGIAEDLGNVKAANMVMVGAFIKQTGLVKIQTVIDNLENIFGARRKKLVEFNKKAIRAGYDYRNDDN